MNTRAITKMGVTIVVSTVVASGTTKALVTVLPKSKQLKIAEMSGGLVGWAAGEELRPYTDNMVDDFFDRRAAKKNQK